MFYHYESIERAERIGLEKKPVLKVFFEDWIPPGIDPELRKQADTIPRSAPLVSAPVERQWIDPGFDTLRQLYQDKGFLHSDEFAPDHCYEIARFQVGLDEVGIVKYCGTYLEILDAPEGDPVELKPLDPFTIQANGVEAEFLLRLDHGIAETFDPEPYVSAYVGVSGYGFPRIDRWSDYRFAWNWTGNDVYWIVPRRHALRLYFRVKNPSGSRLMSKALGRLMGYTQPAASLSAVRNVERGW